MQNALADSDRGGTVELMQKKKVILTAGVTCTPQGISSEERQQTTVGNRA